MSTNKVNFIPLFQTKQRDSLLSYIRHDSFWFIFSQIVRCVTIVTSVSPSCTNTDARRLSSSLLILQASVFATAVTAAISSQGFIENTPGIILC